MRFSAIIVALSVFATVFAAPVPAPAAEAEALALPEAVADVAEPIVAREAAAAPAPAPEPCKMNFYTGACV